MIMPSHSEVQDGANPSQQWLSPPSQDDRRRTHSNPTTHSRSSSSPNLTLPALPPPKLLGNLDPTFLQSRMSALATYMDALLQVHQVESCPSLLAFLGLLEGRAGAGGDNRSSSSNTSDLSYSASVAIGSASSAALHAPHSHGARLSQQLHLDRALFIMDAGDVVLFRTRGLLQGLQRSVTGSHYDHVGLVLRIPYHSPSPRALYILESTSDGVRTYPLSRRLRAWHASRALVVVRRLVGVERSMRWRSILDRFVNEVDGLPYGLSIRKIFAGATGNKRSGKENGNDMDGSQSQMHTTQQSHEQDSFFCSELVASAYMRLNLLDSDQHRASDFFPSSFNQRDDGSELQLLGGAQLGPEMRIEFDLPPLSNARRVDEGEQEGESTEEQIDAEYQHNQNGEQQQQQQSNQSNQARTDAGTTPSTSTASAVAHSIARGRRRSQGMDRGRADTDASGGVLDCDESVYGHSCPSSSVSDDENHIDGDVSICVRRASISCSSLLRHRADHEDLPRSQLHSRTPSRSPSSSPSPSPALSVAPVNGRTSAAAVAHLTVPVPDLSSAPTSSSPSSASSSSSSAPPASSET